MRKITKLRLALATVIVAVLSGTSAAAPTALRICAWNLPFNLPVMWEKDAGTYARTFSDMKVEMIDLQSGPRQMAAIAAGDLDCAQGIGDTAFLISAAAGSGVRIIAVNSRSPKAFAVMTNNPDIRSVSDLRGARIAGIKGSIVHQVLVTALAEAGLSESDIEFFPMPVSQAAAALVAGKIDAALLVGGEIVVAKRAGARVLADGEGRVRGVSFVLAGERFLRENPDFARRFRDMRRATLAAIKADSKTALAIAMRETGLGESDAEEMMSWYDFTETFGAEDMKSLEDTLRYLTRQGVLKSPVDLASLVWK